MPERPKGWEWGPPPVDELKAGTERNVAQNLVVLPVYKRFWWPHVYARERGLLCVKAVVGYRYFIEGVETRRWW